MIMFRDITGFTIICDWYDYVQRHNRVYYNLRLV